MSVRINDKNSNTSVVCAVTGIKGRRYKLTILCLAAHCDHLRICRYLSSVYCARLTALACYVRFVTRVSRNGPGIPDVVSFTQSQKGPSECL